MLRHRPVRRRLLGAALLVVPVLAVVPAGAAGPGDVGGSIVVGPGGATLGYVSKVAVEPQGTPLTFVNADELAHTVTSVGRDTDGKPLFSGNALPGSTSTVLGVDKLRAGSYAFFCSFHPNMTGTLVVQGGSGGKGAAAPRFELPLRLPRELTGSRIVLSAEQADVQVLPRSAPTAMWTYGGSWPGPTIRRPVGARTTVTVVNRLPVSVGETSLHVHGDHHSSADDGQPHTQLVAPGGRKTYTLPLTDGGRPEAAAFSWYHDHRMDVTGRNNWNGLQGMVITDDPAERRLGLPSGGYDLPLLVADRSFDDAGQLLEPFPHQGDSRSPTAGVNGPYAPPGDATAGNRTLVNGSFQPYATVATHRYRLRLLNASGFTSYDFHFTDGRPFVQVGNGSALLEHPVTRTDVLLGPAERADVVVDFGRDIGKSIVLESIARTGGSPLGIGTPTTPVMQFRVARRAADTSRVPVALRPLAPLAGVPALPTATWAFGLGADPGRKGTVWTVNGKPYDPTRVDLTIPLGSVQRWRLVNTSPITHFIHLHEEAWRTLSRDGQPPPAWEAGLQDTWRLDPGETVEVAARITDYTGTFLVHCHMLDHEDHGMMATFAVVPAGATGLPVPAAHLARAGQHPTSGTSVSAIASAAWCRREENLA